MGELHKRFGPALAELADAAGVARALDESDNRPVWWPAGVEWRQTYGSFEPGNSAYATLAFETVAQPAVVGAPQQVRVVRYRPGKRCTLRIGSGELEVAVASPLRFEAAGRRDHDPPTGRPTRSSGWTTRDVSG